MRLLKKGRQMLLVMCLTRPENFLKIRR